MGCEKTAAVLSDCFGTFDFSRAVIDKVSDFVNLEIFSVVLKYNSRLVLFK